MTPAQGVDSNAAKNGTVAAQNSSVTSPPSTAGAKTWIWWSVGVLVVLIIIAIIWVAVTRKKKRKHYN